MPQIHDSNFVFLDTQGKRWPKLRLYIFLFSAVIFCCTVLFVQSLFVVSKLQLPPSIQQLTERLKVLQKNELLSLKKTPKPIWLEFSRTKQTRKNLLMSAPKAQLALKSPSQTALPPALQKPVIASTKRLCLGFYAGWDHNSLSSLQAHANQLTHVCPGWLIMQDGTGTLLAKPDLTVQGIAQKNGIVLLPLLTNLLDDAWQPEAVEGVANGPDERRSGFIEKLIVQLEAAGAGGVVIDWGEVDPTYKVNITKLLQEIAGALHEKKMELWLRIPMGRELLLYDLETLSLDVDHFIAVLHDENSDTDAPGPIASQDWVEGWLDTIIAYGKPSQWVVELGSYGYDWANGSQRAETISFADVMTRAGRAGLQSNKLEAPTYNPNFSYSDAGTEHTVWFLDVATFINQLKAAHKLDIGGFALYELGAEDPAIWKAISKEPFEFNREMLHTISTLGSGGITQVGSGEFLTIEDSRSEGSRNLEVDISGNITEIYEKFPSYLTVSHQGNGKGLDQVAITFDDGPDPKWTPELLDILKAKGVKAAFFMVGIQMEDYPGLVRRIVNEGHEVGVHTYTHPNLALVSDERVRLELNATQRLLETITGRSTILFRPPYNADSRPTTLAEVLPLKTVQDMGYLTVAEDVDPEDWAKPNADELLERIKLGRQFGGNVILLHDSGGDRSQTLAALPLIIDYLYDRGDQIVTLGKLLGESPEVLMPIVKKDQNPITRFVSGSGFRAFHFTETFLWSFMIVATVLVVLRTLAVSALALLQQRRSARSPKTGYYPSLSVLIAAFNEEKVIAKTLESVLNTTYPGDISVWIVDDGSADGTSRVVEMFAAKDKRVHLIRQTNQGKALALRRGLVSVPDDIVVTLDADTQFRPDTLMELVQPLKDDRVAAVSGHAKVGNLRKFIARCQSLEYICGFNLDRQAYHYLNCITVVPGAVSALRKSAIMQAGGISTDTLAEDTDMTISLHRKGYLISYAAKALAYTEAPETIASLAKQRFRWGFGTIQCLWKHRDMVMNPHFKALGCFSLPGIWFFQVLLVAIAPIIDLLVILSLILGWSSPILYTYFAIFLLMDILLAALACLMEHEPIHQAWLAVPMRFVYRPMLSWVIWKSLIKAAKGVLVSWGKLERTASVN
jgi:peptidoglycan-N-acetylglucosamine deacetylase